jgi:glycosyltransferase involved in cell wall biosynthesis
MAKGSISQDEQFLLTLAPLFLDNHSPLRPQCGGHGHVQRMLRMEATTHDAIGLPHQRDTVLDLDLDHGQERSNLLRRLLGEGPCRQLGICPIPPDFLLSVIIPVYNEEQYIRAVVERVQAVPLPKEILIINDCSTDSTREILEGLEGGNIRVLHQPLNQGKGAALRRGFERATGSVVLVQDADLEYDPAEYPRLIQPILDNRADVVFGSRFVGESHRVLYFWHSVANRVLTTLSNMFTNLNLTDMETCYKVFRREVLKGMTLKSNRFGFEPEVTAKIAKKKSPAWRIYEVPVSYSGRTYEEGKKIGLKDAIQAFFCIVRYWLAN